MTAITQLELELLREEQITYMPEKVKIRRPRFAGDNERDYEDIAVKVWARLTPGFGFWRSVADRYQGITAFTITMPWDTDCQAGDIIIDSSDRAYEVRDTKDPSTYHTALQVLCDRISDG
jgi:Phage head-tail joining protein